MFAPEVIKQLADQIVKEAVSMIEQQNRINQYPLIVNGKQAQEILGCHQRHSISSLIEKIFSSSKWTALQVNTVAMSHR